MMVPVLSSLDNFVRVEMLFVLMHGLFGTVVPTCVHPLLAFRILPGAVDLGDNGLGHIIGVLNVNPVSDLPQFSIMENAIWERKPTFFHHIFSVGLALFGIGQLLCLFLEDGQIELWDVQLVYIPVRGPRPCIFGSHLDYMTVHY